MSFNRRGGPDRRPDRPPRREGGFGDRPGGRPYPPRDRPPREGGDRPYGGGDRPYGGDRGADRRPGPRPRFERAPDEGGMSIRLDPRRVNALKHLAGEAGMRPGDLVRHWVEERIDAARVGEGGSTLEARIGELETRIAALEGANPASAASSEPVADGDPEAQRADREPHPQGVAEGEGAAEGEPEQPNPEPEAPKQRRRASAAPAAKVALHDEMIAVIRERGPMAAGELAAAISERGRYAPPRSGRPIDAAMVSQRASNPTYRSRFLRREGRIGLAEDR